MKKHTFPTIVICILLASVLLLTGCIYAVMDDKGTPKPYTTEIAEQIVAENSTDNSIIDPEPPVPQSEMQKKFGVYLHETDSGVRIFSEEQYDELKAVRDRGERIPLTYDEVLYLISDSINLYFKYDEITLTNAIKDSVCLGRAHETADTDDLRIVSYHGDYSEYSSTLEEMQQAYQRYDEIKREIGQLLFYRFSMHDAGFVLLTHYTDRDGNSHPLQYRSGFLDPVFYALSTDGSTVSGDENKNRLQRELGKLIDCALSGDTALQESLNAPLLLLPTLEWFETVRFVSSASTQATTVFPTAELNARAPETTLYLTASLQTEDGLRHTLHLNRETSQFLITYHPYNSHGIIGTFTETASALTLYPENLDGEETYFYRFYRNGIACSSYIYNPTDSRPHADLTFPDGMAFCRDYKDYLTKKALAGNSNAWYSVSGDQFNMHQSILTHAELTFEDGQHTVVEIDTVSIEEYIKQNQQNILETTLYPDEDKNGVQVRFEDGGILTGITVFTQHGTEWIGTNTTLEGLSDLPEGEYYVAFRSKVTRDSAPCTATCQYTDVLKLFVKRV